VDPRLHQLQGKAKRVTATELLEFLREFHRDKLAQREQHAASARNVGNYDFNNTYQYIIAREDLQLNWLRDALASVGQTVAEAAAEPAEVSKGHRRGRANAEDLQQSVIAADRDAAQAFVEKWTTRVEGVTNARHRTMMRVILGETLEHKRFFEQALAGRSDLLGRHADGAGTVGAVMGTRWVE
jgi:hypothetical protein